MPYFNMHSSTLELAGIKSILLVL